MIGGPSMIKVTSKYESKMESQEQSYYCDLLEKIEEQGPIFTADEDYVNSREQDR